MDRLVLSAISNKTRLKLIICLSEGEKNVTQLISKCTLSQSAVSQHLEKLRIVELVTARKMGKEVYYSLKDPKTAEICQRLLKFLDKYKNE